MVSSARVLTEFEIHDWLISLFLLLCKCNIVPDLLGRQKFNLEKKDGVVGAFYRGVWSLSGIVFPLTSSQLWEFTCLREM